MHEGPTFHSHLQVILGQFTAANGKPGYLEAWPAKAEAILLSFGFSVK